MNFFQQKVHIFYVTHKVEFLKPIYLFCANIFFQVKFMDTYINKFHKKFIFIILIKLTIQNHIILVQDFRLVKYFMANYF